MLVGTGLEKRPLGFRPALLYQLAKDCPQEQSLKQIQKMPQFAKHWSQQTILSPNHQLGDLELGVTLVLGLLICEM